MGCLDNRRYLRQFIHRDLLQSAIRMQAHCCQLGPMLAPNCGMRQPRSDLYRYGCDWDRNGCDADLDSRSDYLGPANADETENWTNSYVRRRINVSVNRGASRALNGC